MKICILTSAHSPYDARIFYKEAVTLKKAGYEIVIIAPVQKSMNSLRTGEVTVDKTGHCCYQRRVSSEGIEICYVPPFKNRTERFMNIRHVYKNAIREKADVYHFHDPDLIPIALKLKKKTGKPVIYDVHEYYADSFRTRHWIPAPLRRVAAAMFDLMEKRAVRKFSAIITVNTHMEELFRKYNPVGTVLYNFPLQNQFNFQRPGEKRLKMDIPTILYLGGINRERGLEVILDAMSIVKEKHPEAVCEMVGDIDTGGLSEKYQPIEQWAKKGNIRLRGKVDYKMVPAIMSESTVALVPLLPTLNYMKAIPVKLIEYMASGLPVIGSCFGYIEKIVKENNCGLLVEPGNPEELANAVCRLIEHPREALGFAQSGWDAFRHKYCWENEELKLIALYKKILCL